MDEGGHPNHAAPPYLPGEITDVIISFLPDVDYKFVTGYSSLCSCALVCRNWLPASRHNLFTHVTITSDEQYALFVSTAVGRQPELSWLLSTRRFSLNGFIRDSDPDRRRPNAARLFIHELGGQFPNLEVLYFQHLNFDMMEITPSPRKFAALSAFASVRTLRLWRCNFPSFAAARYTLASLPSLTNLGVGNITWPIARTPEPPPSFLRSSRKSSFLRTVRRLEFWDKPSTTCDELLLQWLSTTSLAISLADLIVDSTTFRMKVTGFWEYVGWATTRLSITHVQAEDLLKDSDGFAGSLHHFTRLESLVVDVTEFKGKMSERWESIGALISTGSLNPGLKILSIRFTWVPPSDSIDSGFLSSGLELVLAKAEVLDPLIDSSFKQLITLSLGMGFGWPSYLEDDGDHLRTCFSQPAIESALRKKLPKVSQKVSLNVSVSHLGPFKIKFPPSPPEVGEGSTIQADPS